jgi:hypothetical protein
MNNQVTIRSKDDDLIEWQFVEDYSNFALKINFLAITALLEKARSVSDPIKRKSICLSGLQLLYSSYEDHAILLHAFLNKKGGKHLHLTIGFEKQDRLGSTDMPQIFKYFNSTRELLDNFGFTSITDGMLYHHLNINTQQLEYYLRDIANSIKGLGTYQGTGRDYKNKLKHGKPVVQSIEGRIAPYHVIFPNWSEENGKPVLNYHFVEAFIKQLEIAIIQVGKIYIKSLELLYLFMLNYYQDHSDKFLNETLVRCSEECIEQVRALGLNSQGLT